MLFCAFCVSQDEKNPIFLCPSCGHSNTELITKDKEKLQNQNIMQTNRPYKLFAESCAIFLGPMLSCLRVELDYCTSCEAGCLWKAKSSYHSLSHIQGPPVVCGVAVCPTEGDNQYQIREWGIKRKLMLFIGVMHGLNRAEASESR